MALEEFSQEPTVPSFIFGADNHNLGNDGTSWLDPETWERKAGNAGKFTAAAILSGADSLYNSAATVANWFGADAAISDTSAWISSIDQDLGQYYSQNRQAADLAGFIASSFVPGLGGVKILNAGQKALIAAKNAGTLGSNLSKYTGILAPSTENFVKLAGREIASAQTVFSSLNANTVKALGAGLWQNTLEAAAFEGFVQATLFKSPILEQQDSWDIAKNMLIGSALGGTIGGAFEAARTFGAIKKVRIAEDARIKTWSSRETVQEGTSPADKIILAAENRSITPLPSAELPANATADEIALHQSQLANATAARNKKLQGIDLDNRRSMHEMNAGASDDLVNRVADTQIGIGVEDALRNWHGAVEISAPLKVTKAEAKAIESLEEGFQSRYVHLAGENYGRVDFNLPPVVRVADRVSHSGSIKDNVIGEVQKAGFKADKLWNPLSQVGKLSWREAELRHIWADRIQKIPENITIHVNDIPLLERLIVKDSRLDFKVVIDEKNLDQKLTFSSLVDAEKFLISQKEALANDLLAKRLNKGLKADTDPVETTTAAIAKVVNVKQSFLEGTRSANISKDVYAWQDLTDEIHNSLVSKGKLRSSDPKNPSYFEPTLAKINYRITDDIAKDGHVLDGLAFIKARQKILHEDAVRVVAKQAGAAIAERMVDISLNDLKRTNSYGSGPSMLGSAQSAYGSVESRVQYLGGVSRDLQIAKRGEVNEALQSHLYSLANNQKAAIEFETVNQTLARTSEHYVFDAENYFGRGPDTLVPKRFMEALFTPSNATNVGERTLEQARKQIDPDKLAQIRLQEGAPEFIKIENFETLAALKAHNQLTGLRTVNARERWAAVGKRHEYDSDVVRPIRPNPKDYPHFAFVKDPRVTGSGHTTMLFANTEKELQELINKTQRDFPEFQVLTKRDTAEWHDAHKSYEYSLGLNENYIDSSLKAKGIYSNFYSRSDAQVISNDALQFHYRSADLEAAEIMRLRYNEAFDWLENQAESFATLESSKFGAARYDKIVQNEKNPYVSYIKTALNLPSTPTSNPWWSLNKFLDAQVSRGVARINGVWNAAKSPTDLEEVNALMQKYGSSTAFNSAAEVALINHTAPKAELSKFVRGANAIMSRFTLGLDPLNSLNNAIGANVLRGTELTQLVKAIQRGNQELAGELSGLAKVRVPGTESEILSAPKLMARSIARLFSDEGKTLLQEYKNLGFIRDRLEQFRMMADDLTLRGTETVADLDKRLNSAFKKAKAIASEAGDKGETLTGNKFAEEFNRFVSADVMRQLTDLAQKHGILNQRESLTYINNFVNRVEGNIIASQRPGLFQGPMGQAIGLFQSYQFNLLQQLFRYVAEGEKKDLGMLLGLQGTFYGLQGEPGFKFINDHIVGTASGNQQHRDMYDGVRGIFGKDAGNWLLYGTASNLMQTNIYSRGDINPRHVTIIPTNIADVPFVGGMSKVFGTLYETTKKLANGGDVWETIRQGIEHNGVSRPLAGLAQVSRAIDNNGTVFSTSSKGSILGSNDLMSLASLSRMAGGRPLDEAILNDTMFSVNSYEAYDRARKNFLAETIKTHLVKSKNPDADEITAFAEQYAYLGGKQGSFAKYMMEQYTKANTPAAELLYRKINNPLSYKVQVLMGGQDQP